MPSGHPRNFTTLTDVTRARLAGTSVTWFLHEIEQWLSERAEERSRHHYADF